MPPMPAPAPAGSVILQASCAGSLEFGSAAISTCAGKLVQTRAPGPSFAPCRTISVVRPGTTAPGTAWLSVWPASDPENRATSARAISQAEDGRIEVIVL